MDEDVRQLHVSVQYVHCVNRLEPLYNLTQQIPRFLLREATSQLAQVIKVSTIAVLHEEVEIIHGLLDIVEADHVWAADSRQDSYLALEILLKQRIQIGLLDDLASEPFNFGCIRICWMILIWFVRVLGLPILGILVSREDHLAVLAFTQYCRSECIVSHDFLGYWISFLSGAVHCSPMNCCCFLTKWFV